MYPSLFSPTRSEAPSTPPRHKPVAPKLDATAEKIVEAACRSVSVDKWLLSENERQNGVKTFKTHAIEIPAPRNPAKEPYQIIKITFPALNGLKSSADSTHPGHNRVIYFCASTVDGVKYNAPCSEALYNSLYKTFADHQKEERARKELKTAAELALADVGKNYKDMDWKVDSDGRYTAQTKRFKFSVEESARRGRFFNTYDYKATIEPVSSDEKLQLSESGAVAKHIFKFAEAKASKSESRQASSVWLVP